MQGGFKTRLVWEALLLGTWKVKTSSKRSKTSLETQQDFFNPGASLGNRRKKVILMGTVRIILGVLGLDGDGPKTRGVTNALRGLVNSKSIILGGTESGWRTLYTF